MLRHKLLLPCCILVSVLINGALVASLSRMLHIHQALSEEAIAKLHPVVVRFYEPAPSRTSVPALKKPAKNTTGARPRPHNNRPWQILAQAEKPSRTDLDFGVQKSRWQ